ncbi:Uncharacterized protein dnl_05850 [Desulfonema limicola]|uniref:Uncharacterized protein n=1 Tax=Desulfonema limicola TaxID=45656 RepID=A0A975B400_9BACT|nr:hypothetical protein [Desulfonema limicola]QTA78363.1 Uncharacterized protein dnl_05850 [Desulfonema limicola]
MKPCSNYDKTLFLDVYGEMKPGEQSDILNMIFNIKEAAPCADLLPDEARSLAFSIKQKLNNENQVSKWQQWIQNILKNPVPALAAACLVFLVFGWFGTKGLENHWPMQTASNLSTEEKLLIKDFEVIKNLDLLEEMDALEKLVQVVDKREYGSCLFDNSFFAQKEKFLNEYKV